MRASAFEYRFRVAIMVAVIALGFWAPWIEAFDIGRRNSLLEWLPLELSRLGVLSFTLAVPAVIGFAALLALVAAVLRVWGTAYLGPGTVNSAQMKAGPLLADGPYRYVRNPLYIGSWFMIAAMAFVMPATGALFVLALLTVFLVRLILGEEAFLAGRLGDPYLAYMRAAPRMFPRLRAALPPGRRRPRWLRAVLAEINPIGVFVTLAALSWSYNHWLLIQGILVSFGVSLVVRALMPRSAQ